MSSGTDIESQNSGEGITTVGSGSPEPDLPRIRSRPNPFLITCRCFRVISSLAAILCIVVNIISAVKSFKNESDIFDGIFRCYAVIIAIFVVIAETEWEFIIKFSKVFEYWAGRGMLQIFVAVMTRAYPEYLKNNAELFLLQSITPGMRLSLCYISKFSFIVLILGLLCIGMLKRARQKKELSREQNIKDLEDRRREEHQSLLIDRP